MIDKLQLQDIKDDLQSGRIFLDGILYENAVWLIEQLEKSQKALELERVKSRKWEKAFDNADRQYLKKEREAAELRRKLEQSQAVNQNLIDEIARIMNQAIDAEKLEANLLAWKQTYEESGYTNHSYAINGVIDRLRSGDYELTSGALKKEKPP